MNKSLKIMVAILSIIILIGLRYRALIAYGIGQARGQLAVIGNSVEVEELMNDPQFPDSLKSKLMFIDDVRTYAISQIGLQNSSNYTTYYDQKGKVALWNLSGCKPYSLEPKEWKFPFLGSFPYKGFFDIEKAKEEEKRLLEEGYETRLRPVGGWSTLGWTRDPILSSMLQRSKGGLAELIIHELTHATLFIKDDVIFNENLASFIGETGARQYLTDVFGVNSQEYITYIQSETDHRIFRAHMLHATKGLDLLYKSFSSQSDSAKESLKHMFIDEIMSSLDTNNFSNDRYYRVFDDRRPNNAFFMSYARYYSAEDSLNELYVQQYQKDLTSFIVGMKEYHK